MRVLNEEKITELYEYIIDYQYANNFSPTVSEMCKAVDIKSKETVSRYVEILEERGKLKKTDGKYRNIQMINPVRMESFAFAREIGSIKCGLPAEEEEQYGDGVALPVEWFGNGDLYILEASGDSMINAGIEDGDKLVIKRQDSAYNGQIVVALVDGRENTLKRYYDEGDKYRLVAENDEYDDIVTLECRIQGVLVSCIKFY